MIGSNCVDNEVEAIGVLLHFVGIAGNNDFIRTEAKRIIFLVRRSGEDSDVRSERMSKFHRHMTETTETDHSYLLPLPTPQWRIGEYVVIPAHRSGAAPAMFEVRRNSQDEMFIDDDAIGIATVSDSSKIFVRANCK